MNIAVKADQKNARDAAYALPLSELNPAQGTCSRPTPCGPISSACGGEDPVHCTPDSDYGPYWSITKYNDIMAVDTNHQVFSSRRLAASPSSDAPDATMRRCRCSSPWTRRKHDVQRKAVSPVVSPANLAELGAA